MDKFLYVFCNVKSALYLITQRPQCFAHPAIVIFFMSLFYTWFIGAYVGDLVHTCMESGMPDISLLM